MASALGASAVNRVTISRTPDTYRALVDRPSLLFSFDVLARVHERSDRTDQSIDVSDEIPEFLTNPRISAIYTFEKAGKGPLPQSSRCWRCWSRILPASSRRAFRLATGEDNRKYRVRSPLRESVERISQEKPTKVGVNTVPRNMVAPAGWFRWFHRWPAPLAGLCVEVADRLPGKASQFLRNIQHCFNELLRARIEEARCEG